MPIYFKTVFAFLILIFSINHSYADNTNDSIWISPNNYNAYLYYQNIGNTDYSHLILYGQSLSMGWQSPQIITPTALSGNYMVGTLPLIYDSNSSPTSLNPLIAVKWSQGGEEPIVGLTNEFSYLYRNYTGKNQLFIGSNAGEGGTSIERLSKESINGINYYSTKFLKLLNSTKSIVNRLNKTVSCPAIIFMQGESNYINTEGSGLTGNTDATTEKDKYKQYLSTLKNNMQADIMNIYQQTRKPLFFIYEVAGRCIYRLDMSINMAQVEFAQENDDVFLLNPTYFTPDYNGVHLSTNGSRWYGEMIAKSLYNVFVNKIDFTPVFPHTFEINNNSIKIGFYVQQLPLVFDHNIKETIANEGFEVRMNGQNVPISDIAIEGNYVIITCSKKLVETIEIVYAGINTSGSGNLRDSDSYTSIYTYYNDSSATLIENYTPVNSYGNKIYNEPYPMYNWCSNFYKKMIIPIISDLDVIQNKSQVVNYYDLQGRIVNMPLPKGLYIEKRVDDNGKISFTKFLKH